MKIRSSLFVILVIVTPIAFCAYNLKSTNRGSCPNLKAEISSVRKRRHLAFPTGSVIALVMSGVKTVMTHVPTGWYAVVEGEVLFQLPDEKFVAAHRRKKLHSRQKREAWELLQSVFDNQNFNGRACLLRSICEAKLHLAPKGNSLVHDILRSMFMAPLHDENFINEIGIPHDELLESEFCKRLHDCPFSFVSFILELNKQT